MLPYVTYASQAYGRTIRIRECASSNPVTKQTSPWLHEYGHLTLDASRFNDPSARKDFKIAKEKMRLQLRYFVFVLLACHVILSYYNPALREWREIKGYVKLSLPGNSEKELSEEEKELPWMNDGNEKPSYAYATLLCDSVMADAALVLVHSLKATGTPFDILVLSLKVPRDVKDQLQRLGAKIIQLEKPISYPFNNLTRQRKSVNKQCR